jgi:UDP-N-acetylmuramate dehydrogenase
MLFAECGVHLSQEIKKLANLGLRLSDELYGIPASFGGAVYNNAGAYGKDLSNSLVYARLFSPEKRKILVFDRSDMAFSYRKSILQKENLIFLGGEFLVSEAPPQEILDRLNSIFKKRLETQPYEMPSLGSIFKRNGFAPVSKLIDELGLKGVRVGDAEISQKHAGFIVNRGSATAEDVKRLVCQIKEKIYEKYGFYPEEEIEYL